MEWMAPAPGIAMCHIGRHPAKLSMTNKRLKAGWNEQFLVSLIS